MAGKAVAKRKNTAVADVDAQLAAEVDNIADRVGSISGNRIKTADKVFTFPDGTVDAGPVELVIIDFTNHNKLYDGPFDQNNPQSPICFAIGKTIKDMAPSPNAPEPQADSCAECPMNQFGSDGKGKACKNTRELAVVPPDGDPEAPLMTLSVSPTGIKNYDAYVATTAKLHAAPPVKFITEVSMREDKTFPSLSFRSTEANEHYAMHFGRREEAAVLLEQEPETSAPDEQPAPRRKATPKRKAAPRRKAARR